MTHCNVTRLTLRPVAFSGRESVYIDFFFFLILWGEGGGICAEQGKWQYED